MAIYPESGAYTVYGEETGGYGVAPGTVNSHLGLIQEVTPKITNNYREYRGVGSGRNPVRVEVAGLLDVGIPLTFQIWNGTFLKYVLGSVSGAGTAEDPYVYAEADTVPSLTIEDAYNMDTDEVIRFLGSILGKTTITGRLGEPVSINAEIMSYDVTKSHTYQSITVPTTALYVFTHGTYEVPTSTEISEVQEFSLAVDNKARRVGGIGSRRGQVKVSTRSYSGSAKIWIHNGTQIEQAMGDSSATSDDTPDPAGTLRLNFTNGSKYLRIVLTNVYFDWTATKAMEREIEENTPFTAMSCAATEVV